MHAFLLAGGRSTRMGSDKALLEIDGRPMVEHMLAKMAALEVPATICGDREDLARLAPTLSDNFPHCGPLGGLEAALSSSASDLNLFLAVDLPGMPVEFLRWMRERAERTQADATLPYLAGRAQPLCAIYHRRLAPELRVALQAGEYRVIASILRAARVVDAFHVEQIVAAGEVEPMPQTPAHMWFQNLNTPAELARFSSIYFRMQADGLSWR